jgi:hypothetical protein
MRRSALAAALLVLVSITAVARATPRISTHDLPTLFYVAKSDDRNRVDYGVHLDATCAPQGEEPLFAYWRRFEPGQEPLGDLNMLDRTIYGIAQQRVASRAPDGSWIEVSLRALPARRVLVLVQRAGSRCVGAAQTEIRGRESILDHVFVQLAGPASIDHAMIRGEERASGDPISERYVPR